MNITKRMLRFGAAAVAVAIGSNALATGLTVPWYESFEGHTNNPVAKYDEGASATNLANWVSTPAGGDASFITNMTYTFSQPPGGITFPIPNPGMSETPNGISSANHSKVLRLNTEGATLSANLDTGNAQNDYTGSKKLYVDTMVNMVISEDAPSFTGATDVKVAVFANATSNIVIRHGKYVQVWDDENGWTPTHAVTNTATSVVIDPAKWYRMTITMRELSEGGSEYSLFSLALDGETVTNANARVDNTWFDAAVSASDIKELSSVAFQGTGFIDDLVVTASDPFAPTGPITVYVIEEYVDGVGPTYIEIDENGWSKGYTPSDTWSKIGLDTGSAAIFGVSGNTVSTGSATEEQLRGTNRVEVLTDVAMTAADLGGDYSDLSEAQIAWLSGLGYPSSTPFDTDGHSLAFEEAMDLDPYANETVVAEITAFVVGDPDSMITVNVKVNSADYVKSGLTVKILVDTKADLADVWAMGVFTQDVSEFDANGEASITFTTPAANFFRARIVEQ